jgi:hypothetical protein
LLNIHLSLQLQLVREEFEPISDIQKGEEGWYRTYEYEVLVMATLTQMEQTKTVDQAVYFFLNSKRKFEPVTDRLPLGEVLTALRRAKTSSSLVYCPTREHDQQRKEQERLRQRQQQRYKKQRADAAAADGRISKVSRELSRDAFSSTVVSKSRKRNTQKKLKKHQFGRIPGMTTAPQKNSIHKLMNRRGELSCWMYEDLEWVLLDRPWSAAGVGCTETVWTGGRQMNDGSFMLLRIRLVTPEEQLAQEKARNPMSSRAENRRRRKRLRAKVGTRRSCSMTKLTHACLLFNHTPFNHQPPTTTHHHQHHPPDAKPPVMLPKSLASLCFPCSFTNMFPPPHLSTPPYAHAHYTIRF